MRASPCCLRRLTRQFGSQTAKRKLEARLAAAVSAEAVGDTQALNQIMDSAAGRAQAAGAGRVRSAWVSGFGV